MTPPTTFKLNWSLYAKAYVALTGFIAQIISYNIFHGTLAHDLQVAAGFLTLFGVFFAPYEKSSQSLATPSQDPNTISSVDPAP